MRFVIISYIIVLIFAIQAPALAQSGWSCDPDTTLPVVVQPGNQWNAQMTSDGKHGVFIVWQDRRDGINDKLYAQHLNGVGHKLWAEGGIPIAVSAGYQYYPQIIGDGTGGAYIVWQDNRASSDYDIYLQKISASGEKMFGDPGVVVCSAPGHQYYPRMTAGVDGEVIIAWQDKRSGGFDVYAQAVSRFGQPLWTPNGIPVSNAVSDQVDPKITTDGSGGAIIAWTDYRGESGSSDIYAQRVRRNGTFAWVGSGVAICTAGNTQWNPQIVADAGGGAHIVWQDRRNSFYDLLYAQRVDGVGNVRWDQNGIPATNAEGNQYYPRISKDGSGGVLMVWQDNRNGADYDIYAQRINQNGQLVWPREGRIVSNAPDHQYYPQLVFQNGSFVTAWQDHRNGNYDIYAQRFDLLGDTHWPVNGVQISNTSVDQYIPALASDSLEGAIICWADFKGGNGSTDIYAHRIGANGMLAGGCFRTLAQDSLRHRRVRIPRRGVAMPNEGNVRDSIFGRGAFSQGMIIGVERPDSARQYGWIFYKKSYYVRRAVPQNGEARGLDRRYDRPFTGILRNPSNYRYNNALVGELITLKLNIAASDVRITPEHFGDLIYHDENEIGDILHGYNLRDIADRVDSMLTFWRWYKGIDYTRLFLTLRKINRAFEARIDTVSLRPLRLTPVRSLFSVPFLIPNTEPPIEVPQYVPLALIPEEEYGYSLAQNFPNPFNPLTTIEFVLAYPSAVSVKVYDLTGREVATLVETGDLDEGFHAVDFDASALASGIYFYRLLATPHEEGVRGFSIVRKMMLIK